MLVKHRVSQVSMRWDGTVLASADGVVAPPSGPQPVAAKPIHSGYLLKQSKVLRKWNKRYVVIEAPWVHTYRSHGEVNGTPKSSFELGPNSNTGYTNVRHCFSVTDVTGKKFFFTAQNDVERDRWILGVNAALADMRGEIEDNDRMYDGELDEGYAVYRVNPEEKFPIGIRKAPDVGAFRTGQGVFPGEMLVVTGTLRRGSVLYLQLEWGRGWVFDTHPNDGRILVNLMQGEALEGPFHMRVTSGENPPVGLRHGPHTAAEKTGEGIAAGERIDCHLKFVPFDDETPGQEYFELKDGRGWLFLKHPDDQRLLLEDMDA